MFDMKSNARKYGAIGILATIGMGAITTAYSHVQELIVRVALIESDNNHKKEMLLEVKEDVKEIKSDIKELLRHVK